MTTAQEHYAQAQELHSRGDYAQAEQHYRKVIELFGEYAGALVRLGEVCFLQGRFQDAATFYGRAVRAAPRDPAALGGLGCTLNQLGRFAEALVHIQSAVAISPENGGLFLDLGNALAGVGRLPEAISVYQRAAALDPAFQNEAQCGAGQALARMGRLADAVNQFEAVLSRQPGHLRALFSLAMASVETGRFDKSIACYEQLVGLQPDNLVVYNGLGAVLQRANRHDDALACYRQILARDPNAVAAHIKLGRCLGTLGRTEEAAAAFDAALALDPESHAAHFEHGRALQLAGRFDQASQVLRNAIEKAPNTPSYWFALVFNAKVLEGDPAISALENMVRRSDAYAPQDRVFTHFALAKAYDDCGRCRESFATLEEGNTIQRILYPYDENDELGMLRVIAAQFSADYLASHKACGAPSELPVFIVGMPRSGTTLVEQILASHPGVFGAGEMSDLALIYDDLIQGRREPNGEDLKEIGKRYIERLARKAPDALRITNKMPSNFASIGLIHAAMPGARIIHVRRDPLDTCFSCYANLFDDGHLYTYEQGALGRYYRAYESLMAHWHSVLPPGSMLEVSYEELVGDMEREARRIVAYCGLEWNAACLSFHETERPVGTVSVHQVRQPLYRSSVGRAAAYAQWLGPLRQALEGSGS